MTDLNTSSKKKRTVRAVIIEFGTVSLLFLTIFAVWLFTEYRVRKASSPPSPSCTVKELANKISAPKRLSIINDQDNQRLVWIGGGTTYLLSSGPPCYIFDDSGKLVEWCFDTMEGWEKDWVVGAAYEAESLTLEEACRWAGLKED